jgi:hypothetical protein
MMMWILTLEQVCVHIHSGSSTHSSLVSIETFNVPYVRHLGLLVLVPASVSRISDNPQDDSLSRSLSIYLSLYLSLSLSLRLCLFLFRHPFLFFVCPL